MRFFCGSCKKIWVDGAIVVVCETEDRVGLLASDPIVCDCGETLQMPRTFHKGTAPQFINQLVWREYHSLKSITLKNVDLLGDQAEAVIQAHRKAMDKPRLC